MKDGQILLWLFLCPTVSFILPEYISFNLFRALFMHLVKITRNYSTFSVIYCAANICFRYLFNLLNIIC